MRASRSSPMRWLTPVLARTSSRRPSPPSTTRPPGSRTPTGPRSSPCSGSWKPSPRAHGHPQPRRRRCHGPWAAGRPGARRPPGGRQPHGPPSPPARRARPPARTGGRPRRRRRRTGQQPVTPPTFQNGDTSRPAPPASGNPARHHGTAGRSAGTGRSMPVAGCGAGGGHGRWRAPPRDGHRRPGNPTARGVIRGAAGCRSA